MELNAQGRNLALELLLAPEHDVLDPMRLRALLLRLAHDIGMHARLCVERLFQLLKVHAHDLLRRKALEEDTPVALLPQ
eukprot:2094009-Prymnesium_polylepis.1